MGIHPGRYGALACGKARIRGAKLSDFAIHAERIIYPHAPAGIVIFVANDITDVPDDKNLHQIATLVKSVMKAIRQKYPDIPVCSVTITPIPSRRHVWPKIQKANRCIQQICAKSAHMYFIETEEAFLDQDGKPRNELFQDDRLHLNAQGYKIWAGIIKKELEAVFHENRTR